MFYMVSPFIAHPFKTICDGILPPVPLIDAESFHDNETGNFFVEVRVDQMKVQGMEAVTGEDIDDTISWNEEFLLYVSEYYNDRLSVNQAGIDSAGTSSSVVSLSIVHNKSLPTSESLTVCSAHIALGTLLEVLGDDKGRSETYNVICFTSRPFRR
jgi:hypothetical protein